MKFGDVYKWNGKECVVIGTEKLESHGKVSVVFHTTPVTFGTVKISELKENENDTK
jgi:hypothetical protein